MLPDEVERATLIERAGYNVLNLDPGAIPFDFFTDVPSRAYVAAVSEAEIRALSSDLPRPEVESLAEQIYGPAGYVLFTKGRTAEFALISSLGKPAPTVVTHGLFQTTLRSLSNHGGKIELAPLDTTVAGTAHLDLRWLEQRLRCGGVDLVYLETANNAIGGWPIHLDHFLAVQRACRESGALLVLDGTRLLTNSLLVRAPIFEAAKQYIAASDLFTISCAKELLWPAGGLVGVRDPSLHRRLLALASEAGLGLEPRHARAGLSEGLRQVIAHPELLTQRVEQVRALAEMLTEGGVEVLRPVAGHAVYVILEPELLGDGSRTAHRALQALLYEASGVRAWPGHSERLGKALLRLALPVARFSTEELRAASVALGAALARARAGVPALKPESTEPLHEVWARYLREEPGTPRTPASIP